MRSSQQGSGLLQGGVLKRGTYGMRAVRSPLEMCHAVDTGEGCAPALVAMTVELFLREHIAAALRIKRLS